MLLHDVDLVYSDLEGRGGAATTIAFLRYRAPGVVVAIVVAPTARVSR